MMFAILSGGAAGWDTLMQCRIFFEPDFMQHNASERTGGHLDVELSYVRSKQNNQEWNAVYLESSLSLFAF